MLEGGRVQPCLQRESPLKLPSNCAYYRRSEHRLTFHTGLTQATLMSQGPLPDQPLGKKTSFTAPGAHRFDHKWSQGVAFRVLDLLHVGRQLSGLQFRQVARKLQNMHH